MTKLRHYLNETTRSIGALIFIVAGIVLPVLAQSPTDSMVQIPAGEFWMGRSRMWLLDELGMHLRARLDDQPAHLVELDAYWIDKFEVTNEAYAKFTNSGHRVPFHWIGGKLPPGQEKFPVYNVSWDDAVAYCRFVGKRLPTEAEWERAARAGADTLYPWGDQLRTNQRGSGTDSAAAPPGKRAQFAVPNGPAKVGSFPANAFGIYDAIGNVWEWTADWYGHSYYSVSPDKNPKGPETGMYRVIRGGGWSDSDERLLALHYRNFTNASHRTATVGFRCVR